MRSPALGVAALVVTSLTAAEYPWVTVHAEQTHDTVSVGVMRVGLDPVMVDGVLVGATLSYVAAVEVGRTASPVNLSDEFHPLLQPGVIVRVHLALPKRGCVEPRQLTVSASNAAHRVVAHATLAFEVCAAVIGRSPSDWARTSMMAGRPIQLMWSFLRNQRLRSSLASLPKSWADIRPALGYVDHSCADNCAVVLQLVLAVAALDAIIDPRFRLQEVAAPATFPNRDVGECMSIGELIDAVEADAPIAEEGRIEAIIEALSATVHGPTTHLQCN